jgi:hypothetical protein
MTGICNILRFFIISYKREGANYKKVIEKLLRGIMHYCDNTKIFFFFDQIFYDEIKEVINSLIDEAQKMQNIEVLAYLLDYQNKHFPPEGTVALNQDL